jgi:probable addiction module antidote protein
MARKTKDLPIFDAAEYLDSPADIAAYLSEAFATDDAAYIAQAIGTAARAKGMAAIAEAAGLSRENLYRSLSTEGNPEFETVLRVLRALGVQLTATPSSEAA